jgi:hypothetical protein
VCYKDADMRQGKLAFPRGMHYENDARLKSDRNGVVRR